MDYPVSTANQLREVLRSLRNGLGLTQAGAGELLGVSQMRIAQIEANPERTSYEQISGFISALGGRLVMTMPDGLSENDTNTSSTKLIQILAAQNKRKRKTKAEKLRDELANANW